MNHGFAAVVAGLAAIMSAAFIAIGQIPELTLALSLAAVFGIAGQGLAAYRAHRNPHANTTLIVFCWTATGFVVGWLFVLGFAVL